MKDEVLSRIRNSRPSRRHPTVVVVPRERSVVPLVNILRSRGVDAADGRWQQLAAVRVYPKDALYEAAAFMGRYHPSRRDYTFIWA